jgi:hypothetical protein
MSAVPTVPASTPTLALPAVLRLLANLLPDAHVADREASLELTTPTTEPARLISATVIEGDELRARRVLESPVVGFAAFLDGTQKSQVALYLPGGVPLVLGTVAAVIRDRRTQRMFTWDHAVEHRLYASKAHMPAAIWDRIVESGLALSDTSDGDAGGTAAEHPLALREAAVHRVQKDRERLEQSLALAWCDREQRTLLVDGGISNADSVARSPAVVGVVKSHRTLYASGAALATVLALASAERSSVFLVTSPKRATVASWYLRIRDWHGHDPMWGLVRVEVAAPVGGSDEGLGRRADEVCRWILAEVSPVALPDSRWDKMVYGVKDCEEFLRAIT